MKAYVTQQGANWAAQDSSGFIASEQTQAVLFDKLRKMGYTEIVINGQTSKLAA